MKLSVINICGRDSSVKKDYLKDNFRLAEMIELAEIVESFGYHRLWVAEHIGSSNSIYWKPEILLSLMAATTEKIKIGSAGNLVCAHSPALLAQEYKLLSGLFPGRIDFGLAYGTFNPDFIDEVYYGAPDSSKVNTDKNKRILKILEFLENNALVKGKKKSIPPYINVKPNVWVLGGSGINLAIEKKLNISFSLFHLGGDLKKEYETKRQMVDTFIEQYQSVHNVYPSFNIAVGVVFGETSAKAHKRKDEILAKSEYKFSFKPMIAGTVKECHEELLKYSEIFKSNEVVVCPLFEFDNVKKIKDLEELAKLNGSMVL